MDDKFQDPSYAQGYSDAIANVREAMTTTTTLPTLLITALLETLLPPPAPRRTTSGKRTTSLLTLPAPAPAPGDEDEDDEDDEPPRLAPPVAAGRINIVSGVAAGRCASAQQWAAMGALIGRKARTVKAMFINGDLTVDGRLAATVFSCVPCEGCVRRGVALDCKVPERGVETLVRGGACQVCVEVGGRCTLVGGE